VYITFTLKSSNVRIALWIRIYGETILAPILVTWLIYFGLKSNFSFERIKNIPFTQNDTDICCFKGEQTCSHNLSRTKLHASNVCNNGVQSRGSPTRMFCSPNTGFKLSVFYDDMSLSLSLLMNALIISTLQRIFKLASFLINTVIYTRVPIQNKFKPSYRFAWNLAWPPCYFKLSNFHTF